MHKIRIGHHLHTLYLNIFQFHHLDLALHKNPENLLKCFTQEYATSVLDPTFKRHLDPTGKYSYVQISLQIQVSLHWWLLCPSPSRHISVLLLSTGKKKLASQFNFTYRYIDDVLSINNPDFANYLGQMHPAELEIKDTTESNTSASYLDLLLSIESDGQLRTSLYDKRDDFNFHITNFPFLSSNIPSSPAYGVLSHSSYGMPGLAPLMNVLF